MTRPLRQALLVLALLAIIPACTVGTTGTDDPADTGSLIAVEEPPEPEWRREVSGATVVGAKTTPDNDELALIGAGLDELPAALLEEAGLGLIYRLRDGAIPVEEQTLAFSRGPDIFLIDRTFASNPTVFDMTALLAHELAHVMQFNRLTPDDVAAILGVVDADPIAGSAFVRDFAATGGWIDRSSDRGSPQWLLPNPSGTTAYGATSPEEDMAEAMSLILAGRVAEVSAGRVSWLEEVLGVDGSVFTTGKPFVPEGAERIDPSQPLFTTDAVAITSAVRADPITFILPANAANGSDLAREIEVELQIRSLGGSLEREADTRIEKYSGTFLRGDGLAYWVELWDFRNAPGYVDPPATPVLTYVILWG